MQLKHSQKSQKLATITAMLLVMGLTATTPARADDLFDMMANWTTKLANAKNLIIYFSFLAGLGGIVWAGLDMLKKSKDRGGEDVTWKGIAIKFVAGAILVGLTLSTDTMRQTVFGKSAASSSTSNMQ
jgi:hypothetical protein